MRIVVGYGLEEFKRYYRTLDDLRGYFQTLRLTDVTLGELGPTEESIVKADPSHLIIMKENNNIIGHAVWHESSTEEHRKGDPRDKEDTEALERLIGKKKDFIELHELWLSTKHRRKGYGTKFFNFFEDFVTKRSHNSIIYYTENPAAITICRKRGYKETYLEKEKWHIFYLLLKPR